MKQNRRFFSLFCLCFIGLVIVFLIGVRPGLQKTQSPGWTIQPVNPAIDHRMPKEIQEEKIKTAEKEVKPEEILPKFKADYWRNHTRFACKSLNMSTEVPRNVGGLQAVVDDKHKLIMCLNAKVASTYFTKVLALLLGQDPAKDPNHVSVKDVYLKYKNEQPLLKQFSYEERLERLKTFYSAILVREPFGRVLSAYRNKIEKPWKNPRYGEKAKHISRNGTGDVTFPEFVAYLVNSNDRDAHWRPYYQACSPCSMDYDFVAKLETMAEDIKHIFEEINVTDIVPPKPGGKKANAYLEKYYKQVPKEDLWKLYEVYKPDFLIFDYSIPDAIKATMT